MKHKHLRIASIFAYIASAIYALTTALFFSVGNNLYILFLVLFLLTFIIGLFQESLIYRTRINNELNKKDEITLIVITVLSIVSPLAFVFNILALTSKSEAKTKKVYNEAYKEKVKKEKKWYQKPSFIVTVISLAGILLTSVSGFLFETSAGSVSVKDYTLTRKDTDLYNRDKPLNGMSYTIDDPNVKYAYTVYKPKEASTTNLAPVVFVIPGFTRTKPTMSQYAIELSRRGSVVFTIDPGSQGNSSNGGYEYDVENETYVLDENGQKIQNSYAVGRNGMGYLVQYVYNNIDRFDYIDRNKIGIVGHSAGGGDACKLAADFAGDTYEDSIIKSLYISGYIKTSAANVFYKLRCNTGLSYAKYDEGSFRYQDENSAYEVIALRFVNEVNSKTASANGHFDEYHLAYNYGDVSNGTYRIIYREDLNHCFEMYSPTSLANTTAFFTKTLDINTPLKATNQIWFGKELSNGMSLVFAFMLTLALVSVVITFVPFMKPLKVEADERLELEQDIRETYSSDVYVRAKTDKEHKNKGFGNRLLFWIPLILTAIIACLDYIPLARLSMEWMEDAAANVFTSKFPARMMNAVFLWALVNGLIGLVLFFGTTLLENLYYHIAHKYFGKENKVSWDKFKGLKVNPMNLLKSLGLAVVLYAAFYGLLALVHALTHQDYRFMLLAAAPLNARFFVTMLIYLGGFYVFYFANALRVNLVIAREGFKEWQVYLISSLSNILGLVFMLIINYFVYFKTGTVYYGFYSATDSNEMWLYINMIFPLIVCMGLLPIFNRYMYKRVGNVYAGSLLWCAIFITMSLSSSISFIPM